jgi:hypothetical protein
MANNLEKVMAEHEAAEHATMHEHRLIEDVLISLAACWSENDYKGAEKVLLRFMHAVQLGRRGSSRLRLAH